MRKVLIVITTAFNPYGGLTTVMMNYYRVMDKTNLEIDFASTNEGDVKLIEELNANGSKYYNLGDRKKNLIRYLENLNQVLKKNSYDVIHVNGNSATMYFELELAKKNGIKKRIAHGHTTRSNYPFFHNALKLLFRKSYSDAIAVSQKAGDWLYGSDYKIIRNAIDLKKYEFNTIAREEVRKKYNIGQELVLGNVGKLNAGKNQMFLMDVFKKFKEKCNNDAKLMIVGGGELETELKSYAKKIKISDSVIFTGMKNDTSKYLSAMDIFLFPSLFEGLPLSLVEAQANGLPCIVSKNVTTEVKIIENVSYIDLEIDLWTEEIQKFLELKRTCGLKEQKEFESKGYDIKKNSRKMLELYEVD